MTAPLSVDFTRRAAAQTEAATLWWRENRPLAPDALREELEQALQLIALQPEIGATARNIKLAGVRRVDGARLKVETRVEISEGRSNTVTEWFKRVQ